MPPTWPGAPATTGLRPEPGRARERGAAGARASQTVANGFPVHLSAGVILGGIVALGAGLRFALLGQHSLWNDELFVVYVTRFPWPAVPRLLALMDFHPPLYYLLMKAWVGVAGTGETAMRIPSAVLSSLSILLTYALARRVCTERVSLLSALLVSVAPFHIMAGQEARMYPLLGVLVLASTWALAVAVERRGMGWWALYAALAALVAYTQYLGGLVLLAHGLWMGGYARRALPAWLAAMAVAAILYAPWAPLLWYQTGQTVDRWWTHYALSLVPGDLLGLFAFGGSLFGMATYFWGGHRGIVEQAIVLLPFLILLGIGAASLAADRRRLALVGLPPAVTIGVTLALALVKPIFTHPRWFSFLLPFYAMVLAQGLVTAAERLAGDRDRVLACLTAALVLYSVPVLGDYYGDTASRPYRWREAAAAVREHVRPGDFFLYVGVMSEIAFTHYFPDPYPSRLLTPSEDLTGQDRKPTFGRDQVVELTRGHPRVWVIATLTFTPSMQHRLFAALDTAFRPAGYHNFNGAGVYLFEASAPPLH